MVMTMLQQEIYLLIPGNIPTDCTHSKTERGIYTTNSLPKKKKKKKKATLSQ